MAIKVGGTTVIDDSRNLCNVTTASATTVCATTICATNLYGDGGNLTGTGGVTGSLIYSTVDPGTGYIPADGSVLPRSTYPALSSAYGNIASFSYTQSNSDPTCLPQLMYDRACCYCVYCNFETANGYSCSPYTHPTSIVGCCGIVVHSLYGTGGLAPGNDQSGTYKCFSAVMSSPVPCFYNNTQSIIRSISGASGYCPDFNAVTTGFFRALGPAPCNGIMWTAQYVSNGNADDNRSQGDGIALMYVNTKCATCYTCSPTYYTWYQYSRGTVYTCACCGHCTRVGSPLGMCYNDTCPFVMYNGPLCCNQSYMYSQIWYPNGETCCWYYGCGCAGTWGLSTQLYERNAFGYRKIISANGCCIRVVSFPCNVACSTTESVCCYTYLTDLYALNYIPEGNVFTARSAANILYSNDGINWTIACCCPVGSPSTSRLYQTPNGNVLIYNNIGDPVMFVTCDGCNYTRYSSNIWCAPGAYSSRCFVGFITPYHSPNTLTNGGHVICECAPGVYDWGNIYSPSFIPWKNSDSNSGVCFTFNYETCKWIGFLSTCGGPIGCFHENRTWCCIGCLSTCGSRCETNSPYYYAQNSNRIVHITASNSTYVLCYRDRYCCSIVCCLPCMANLYYRMSSSTTDASAANVLTWCYTCLPNSLSISSFDGYPRMFGLMHDPDGKRAAAIITTMNCCCNWGASGNYGFSRFRAWPQQTFCCDPQSAAPYNARGVWYTNDYGSNWNFCAIQGAYACEWAVQCYTYSLEHFGCNRAVNYAPAILSYGGDKMVAQEIRYFPGDDGGTPYYSSHTVHGCFTADGKITFSTISTFDNSYCCIASCCYINQMPYRSFTAYSADGNLVCMEMPCCQGNFYGFEQSGACKGWMGWHYDVCDKTLYNLHVQFNTCELGYGSSSGIKPVVSVYYVKPDSTNMGFTQYTGYARADGVPIGENGFCVGGYMFNNGAPAFFRYFGKNCSFRCECFVAVGINSYGEIMSHAGLSQKTYNSAECFEVPKISSVGGIGKPYIKT